MLSVRLLMAFLISLSVVFLSLTIMLIALIDTAEQFLTEATTVATVAEQATILVLVAIEAALAILVVIDSALRSLLCAAESVWQSLVSRGLFAVLFVIDEVPALREMCPEILDNRATKAKCDIRPSHTRALGPVEFVLLPMVDL
jgi:hypothetical protein